MSDPTPAEGWAELLLALPEFILTDADLDERDQLVAVVELPRDVHPCTRCGVIDHHPVHDRRWHSTTTCPSPGGPAGSGGASGSSPLSCLEGCGTFAERTPSTAPGAVWSRAAARAAVAMSQANVPVDTRG